MSTKLSKRKQKALAFRGKKSKADGADELDFQTELEKAIPLDDPAEPAAGDAEQKPSSSSWLGQDIVKGTSTKTKRKREESQDTSSENKSKKPKTG